MQKITMQEELDALRKEITELKKQKENITQTIKSKIDVEELTQSAQEIKEMVGVEADELVQKIKQDFKTISPASALIIFALGVTFSRIISSK